MHMYEQYGDVSHHCLHCCQLTSACVHLLEYSNISTVVLAYGKTQNQVGTLCSLPQCNFDKTTEGPKGRNIQYPNIVALIQWQVSCNIFFFKLFTHHSRCIHCYEPQSFVKLRSGQVRSYQNLTLATDQSWESWRKVRVRKQKRDSDRETEVTIKDNRLMLRWDASGFIFAKPKQQLGRSHTGWLLTTHAAGDMPSLDKKFGSQCLTKRHTQVCTGKFNFRFTYMLTTKIQQDFNKTRLKMKHFTWLENWQHFWLVQY